jgi:hypothetical protein
MIMTAIKTHPLRERMRFFVADGTYAPHRFSCETSENLFDSPCVKCIRNGAAYGKIKQYLRGKSSYV